jgi:hypothetical protein
VVQPPPSPDGASGATHTEPEQIAGATQSAETPQLLLQLPVASHAYGAHSSFVPSRRVTTPSGEQLAPPVQVPVFTSHTNPDLQSLSDVQLVLHFTSPHA